MRLRTALSPRLLIHLLVLRPLLWLIFGVTIHGREHLTASRPFVVAANHNSHLDILLLFAALPVRWITRTHVVAAADYFARPRWLFATVNFLFQPVWVDRVSGGGEPLAEMRAWLDAGHSVVIFPEGTRGEAGKITSFHRGVGRLLASRPGLAVIPAFLLGPERALPRQSTVPLPFWNHVFLGPPQHLSGDCHDITRALEEVIFGLARSETAARHRRRQVRRPAYVVAVLGIDGSGKSTLTSRLATTMSGGDAAAGSTCLIGDELQLFRAGERAAVQPLPAETLRAWVSRQAKQARSLALYKIPKLTELLLRDRLLAEVRRWYGPDLVFMDGSPLLNMVAWAVLYRDEALDVEVCGRAIGILSGRIDGVPKNDSIYQRLPELAPMVRLGLTRLALPDAVLFLDVEPEVAMTRIESRGERMQAHETAAQLGKLRAAYLQVMAAVGAEFSRTTLVLDGGQEPEAVAAAAARCITAARREMSGEERD